MTLTPIQFKHKEYPRCVGRGYLRSARDHHQNNLRMTIAHRVQRVAVRANSSASGIALSFGASLAVWRWLYHHTRAPRAPFCKVGTALARLAVPIVYYTTHFANAHVFFRGSDKNTGFPWIMLYTESGYITTHGHHTGSKALSRAIC